MFFLRDPFSIVNELAPTTQGTDRNTRIIVFVRNLQLAQGELPSAVLVNVIDANSQSFDVPAEAVRSVSNTDFVQVIFRLPGSVAVGTCAVTVKAHGQASNTGSIRIKI